MVKIIRIYPIVQGKEVCVTDQTQMIKHLSKPGQGFELDYDTGKTVKMGSSQDFAGQTVLVGDVKVEVPA